MKTQKHFKFTHIIESIKDAQKYIQCGWATKDFGVWDIAEMGYWRIAKKSEIQFLEKV
jgi:hypothetical protein